MDRVARCSHGRCAAHSAQEFPGRHRDHAGRRGQQQPAVLLGGDVDVLGRAPSDLDAFTNRVSRDQDPWDAQMLDARHLVLRGENASSLLKLREFVELAFIDTYREMDLTKVSPPAMVQTQVEGGSTLFKYDYYGEEVSLTPFILNRTAQLARQLLAKFGLSEE